MFMSGHQLKAARALIGMEQADLARRAGVSINTIRNLEAAGAQMIRARLDTLAKVEGALKAAGVLFIAENGGGAGVRLRDRA